MTNEVRRTERGWAGHFIGADHCRFRRNTLLECGEWRIVVSTVGNYRNEFINGHSAAEIGNRRYYETKAFEAGMDNGYWEANVTMGVAFDAPWSLGKEALDNENLADQMHEAVVAELTERLAKDE